MLTDRQLRDWCKDISGGSESLEIGASLAISMLCDPDDEDASDVFGWINSERTRRQLAAARETRRG